MIESIKKQIAELELQQKQAIADMKSAKTRYYELGVAKAKLYRQLNGLPEPPSP